jgi:hypothetical protein
VKIELGIWRNFFAQFEGKFLIGGNFNGHHHSWVNSKNCNTGNSLFHCITELETNITFLNDGSQIFISDVTESKAALYLTYVDPRLSLLYTWNVGTDPWNSDHFPIYIEYNGIIAPRKGSRMLLDCIIKTVFMEEVKKKIMEVKMHNKWDSERDVKEMSDNFNQIIKRKLEETTPKRNNKNNVGNGGQ